MARLVLIIADSVVNHLHQQHGHSNSQQSTYDANGPLWPTLAHSGPPWPTVRICSAEAVFMNVLTLSLSISPNRVTQNRLTTDLQQCLNYNSSLRKKSLT